MNFILMKSSYPPVVIYKKTRHEFLNSLKTADESSLTSAKKEDYADLVNFIADEMILSYWNIFL